ncbi:DoxX family membrane protein [Tsukamurella paurometabola]|uniref:DoxX family membrane protein n=1 Tax=Tsukamurella paurometabola TaxID=2061 RepID=A0A3P8KFC3_TSUPA|nr:DoxX family membrane protein [Tsukamurella paurometabola]MBS4103658.1 DoxX family membrane protein [Tsukamurella paurometabola]UEA81602.1 DoxX family membrane protein [Tsukamurella paurometabola]VDR38608.1 Inner membrane protein yphA [Tsukamurella paurometabola]
MDVVFLIGRILLAVLFVMSAVGHFTAADGMAQYAAAKKVPAAKLAVVGSGVVALLGGLSLILGVWIDLGALLLVLFLLPVTLMMHDFWKAVDPEAKQTEMISFNKNLALIGGALILFYFVNVTQSVPLGLTGPLFPAW